MKRKRPGLPKWMRRSKARGQREHAIKRAVQRFGLCLSAEDYDALVADIQAGRARFLFRESLRLTHHELDVGGKRCRVVYDATRKTIVTLLPVEKENA